VRRDQVAALTSALLVLAGCASNARAPAQVDARPVVRGPALADDELRVLGSYEYDDLRWYWEVRLRVGSGRWVYHSNTVTCRGGGRETLDVIQRAVTAWGRLGANAARQVASLARAVLAEAREQPSADSELLMIGGGAEPTIAFLPAQLGLGPSLGLSLQAHAHFTQQRCVGNLIASAVGDGQVEIAGLDGGAPAVPDLADAEACANAWFANARSLPGPKPELTRVAWQSSLSHHYPSVDGRGRRCSKYGVRRSWQDSAAPPAESLE
jgi:hypothetical protein